MPYVPYWFESFGPFLPWVVPVLALAGLWIARCSDSLQIQKVGEQFYYSLMLLVAWVALRTVIANEGCWLIHMASIGAMVLGGAYPSNELELIDHESDVAFNDMPV